MPRWIRKVTVERAALAVALLALVGVAWLVVAIGRQTDALQAQASQMRERDRIAVRPLIRIVPAFDDRRSGIFVRNQGLGPAVVEGFEVRLRGKTYGGDVNQWGDVFEALGQPGACYAVTWPRAGDVLAVGDESRLIVLASTQASCKTAAWRLIGRKDAFSMTLRYQSLYGEHYTWSANSPLEAVPFSF